MILVFVVYILVHWLTFVGCVCFSCRRGGLFVRCESRCLHTVLDADRNLVCLPLLQK